MDTAAPNINLSPVNAVDILEKRRFLRPWDLAAPVSAPSTDGTANNW